MTVGVRDWLKAVREYPAKNQELNELRELLAHSESQLQIGEQKCRQLEDICLAQKRDVKQVEHKLEGCMNALRLFGPKLDTPELLEQFYAAVMPTMDRDGFRLYSTAAKMTGFNPYDVFSYEDNRGMFEEADGHTLMRYLLARQFNAVEWNIVPGTAYEAAVLRDVDTTTQEYRNFSKKLYEQALRKMGFGRLLSPEHTAELAKERKGCEKDSR